MKGKWVWVVNFLYVDNVPPVEGANSVYANEAMAKRKRDRMQRSCDKNHPEQKIKVIVRRCMYFKDNVKEDSFDDYCSVCGGQLKENLPLTETYKSSVNKP